MSYRWTLRALTDDTLIPRLAQDLNNLPEALVRALVLRGIQSLDTARDFFRAGLEITHDPFLLKDMDVAAQRLATAVTGGEKVLVYGDYDVDGTTATAMMTHFLRAQGVEAQYFIPHRIDNGYGLCAEGLDRACELGATLVVALDCGITAIEEAAYARACGLDLIIADHHEPGETLPEAVAVLDPKREDCSYPFTGLSGCGVGFKLIQATLQQLGRSQEEARPYLDLLAISIAADIVPVLDENRALMREGLQLLAEAPRVGIEALASIAGVDLTKVDCATLVFGLGPRINAAGRLGSADRAVDLFLCEQPDQALELARALEEVNLQRRDLDSRTLAQAMAQAAVFIREDPSALVLFHEEWHPGVIGIVASRIAEQFHRPTVMLSGRGATVKGSARSVAGVSIYDALAACREHLLGFGGHHAAAGVSLAVEQIDLFRDALNRAIGEITEPEDLEPEILIDAELHLGVLDAVSRDRFWAVLRQFGPHGPDNPRPIFWARDLEVAGRPKRVGRDQKHLRLEVRQRGGSDTLPVIGFGLGDRISAAQDSSRSGQPLELAFCVNENRWNGKVSLQLEAKDLRVGG
jgi:single-stranded-DNA-specific exonuclease